MPVVHPNSPLGQFQSHLASRTCDCGRGKQTGHSFCYSCFRCLDEQQKQAIQFARNDEDHLEAYQQAKESLRL